MPESRWPVLVLAGAGALQGGVAIAQAVATAALVVAVVRGDPLATIGTVVAGLFLARGVLAACVERLGAWAATRVSTALRGRAVSTTLALPAASRPTPAQLLSLLDRAPTAVEPWVARYLPALVTAAVVPVAAVATMAVLDWRIALIPILTVPLVPLFAALIGAATADETDRRWAALTALSGHFMDVMRGMVTLVNYGRAEHQADTIRRVSDRVRSTTVATLRLAFLSAAALELVASLSVAIVAVFVGLALAQGRMDLAVGLPLILLAPEAYWPLRRVGTEFHAAADGAAALDELLSLAHPPDPPDASASDAERGPQVDAPPATSPGRVRLEGVAVGHDRVLASGIDTTLPRGLTAVVGPSGVGKTTLLEVVAGVREPLAGTVHAQAAHLVGQRPFLVEGDIAANLALGAGQSADHEAMVAALRRVGLATLVADLPRGLASPLGDDGVGVSAGQRSRLALARALLAAETVLVCDEPTAHQDREAAALVRAVLHEEATHRVVVVATHDAELLAMADVVVDLGEHARPADATGGRAPTSLWHAPPTGPAASTASTDAGPSDPTPRTNPSAPATPTVQTSVGAGSDVLRSGVVGGLARACGVALTATSGWLIVAASLEPEILVLLVAIVLVRAFGIARPVLRWWERVRSHDAALGDLARRREALWTVLVPLAPARLGAHGRARLLSGLVDDLDDVVTAQVRVVVPTVAIAVAAVIGLAVAAWALPGAVGGMLALAAGLAAVAVLGFVVEERTHEAVVAARGRVTEVTSLVAGDATAIRGLGRAATDAVGRRLVAAQGSLGRAVGQQAWARALGVGIVPVVVVSVTLVLADMAQAAIAGGLSTPMAALVVLLPLGLGEAVGGDLATAAGEWARARAAARRLDGVIDQSPAVDDPTGVVDEAADGVDVVGESTRLRLVDVAARWTDDRPLLAVPDLDLAPGMHVGLVGANGSGKSTAIAVVARHLDPARGTYEVNGIDVRRVSLSAVRSRLAIVDDEPHVFASTVRNNLLLAAPGASDDWLTTALEIAGLAGWLTTLPEGLSTPIGTGHRPLSGGERSRLAVARAVASRRPVVLLDEPVAHLDHPTALAVMTAVAAAFTDASMVLAMHRPEGMGDLDAVIDVGLPRGIARVDTTTTA